MLKLLLGQWHAHRKQGTTASTSSRQKFSSDPLPYDLKPVNRINPLYEPTDSDEGSNLTAEGDQNANSPKSTRDSQTSKEDPPSKQRGPVGNSAPTTGAVDSPSTEGDQDNVVAGTPPVEAEERSPSTSRPDEESRSPEVEDVAPSTDLSNDSNAAAPDTEPSAGDTETINCVSGEGVDNISTVTEGREEETGTKEASKTVPSSNENAILASSSPQTQELPSGRTEHIDAPSARGQIMAPQLEDSPAGSEQPSQKPSLIQERAKSIEELIRKFQTVGKAAGPQSPKEVEVNKERKNVVLEEVGKVLAKTPPDPVTNRIETQTTGSAGELLKSDDVVTTVASSRDEGFPNGSNIGVAPSGERKFKKNVSNTRMSRSNIMAKASLVQDSKSPGDTPAAKTTTSGSEDKVAQSTGAKLKEDVGRTTVYSSSRKDGGRTGDAKVDSGHGKQQKEDAAITTVAGPSNDDQAKLLQTVPKKAFPFAHTDDQSGRLRDASEPADLQARLADLGVTRTEGSPTPEVTAWSKDAAGHASETAPLDAVLGKLTSEDSGITRGDQVSSDSRVSEQEADQSKVEPPVDKIARKPPSRSSPDRIRESRKYSRHGSRACKHCGSSKRLQQRGVGKGTCDDYYMKVIKDGKIPRRHRPESWASDMSWDEYWDRGYGPALCNDCGHFIHPRSRFGTVRTVAGDRRWSRGNLQGDPVACTCNNCWELSYLDRLRKNLGRGSVRSRYGGSVLCTCGRDGPFFGNDRKVKFAENSQPSLHQEAPQNEGQEIPSNESLSKGSGSSVTFDLSESSPPDADDAGSEGSKGSRKDKAGSQKKSDGSLKKSDLTRLHPWEVEDWERFVRYRTLRKKRRKALFMGLAALALVVFIGLIVAVVMVYLRRKQL